MRAALRAARTAPARPAPPLVVAAPPAPDTHHARTTAHDDEKMLRAHTGTKPERPIDGVRQNWASAPATGWPSSSSHASVAHATRASSQGPAFSRTAGLPVRVRTRERATALALCGEATQHARLPHARTAPRGLKFALGIYKVAALATGLSRSVQGCGAMRRPWAPRGRLAHVRKRAATALALYGEEAQHARLPRPRAALR